MQHGSANETKNIEDVSNATSWWSFNNIIQVAKEKSLNAFQIVRNDLSEFTTTLKNDISQASIQVQEKNRAIFNQLPINSLKTEINSEYADRKSQNNEAIKSQAKSSNSYNRYKDELEVLELNENTYLNDPENDEYKNWYLNYDPDQNKGEISNLLIENSKLRAIYSKLVPALVSNKDFWSRYFYKTKLLEDERKKRLDIIERATLKVNEQTYENLSWDAEEDEKNDDIQRESIEKLSDVKNIEDDMTSDAKSTNNRDNKNVNTNSNRINDNKAVETNLSDKKSEASDDWEKDFEETNTDEWESWD